MEKLKYLQKLFFLLMMVFSLSFACVACGDDEEDKVFEGPNQEQNNNDGDKPFEEPTQDILGIAVTGDVESLGLTYANITGYANLNLLPAGSGNPEIGIEISLSSNDTAATRQEISTSLTGNKFTIDIRQLSSNTEYKYRSFVRSSGLTYYGEYHTFSTKNLTNITTTGEASNITYASVNITSSIQINTLDPKDTLMVGITYSTSASDLHSDSIINRSSQKLSVHDVTGGTYTVTLDELFENTVYYYASYTELNGKYCLSDVKSFTTKERIAKSGAVDLGLSVKWAACNVDATKPEEHGGYYAWGETEEKSNYSLSTYTYEYAYSPNQISGTQYDVAYVKLGKNWRMPTWNETRELIDDCNWEWTTYNGISGQLITGPNGNSIFLPAAGYRDSTICKSRGEEAHYWTGHCTFGAFWGWAPDYLYSDSIQNVVYCTKEFYSRGLTVRPVTDELLSDNEK